MKKTKRVSKYWICDTCVARKHPDWIYPHWPVTVTSGLCGHCRCKDEVILTPIVDFGRQGKEPMWD